MKKQTAAFGSWSSAITPELMVSSNIGLSQPMLFDDHIYWLEHRPQEQGRSVVVKRSLADDAQAVDVLSAQYNCRTRVHEYGGACYLPTSAGLFFVNFTDQQVYCVHSDGQVKQVTRVADTRFADFAWCESANMLVAVAEQHSTELAEPLNTLVSIDIGSGEVRTLVSGEDFYASASFSPDGSQLCWLSWNHPNMPWDGTTLWVADVKNNALASVREIAGGEQESVFQPQWSPSSELYYVSDRSNWWNLYSQHKEQSVCPMAAEFGMPQWVFGMRRYAFIDGSTIITSYSKGGVESLASIDAGTGELTTLARPHSSYDSVYACDGVVCYTAQSSETFPALYVCSEAELATSERCIATCSTLTLAADSIAQGVAISYPTGGGEQAHGFFYPPVNAAYAAPAGELPPLIVMIHGGPTSATHNDLSLKVQFWTSRGFAVFDSNYRGSTGYGRQYRDALKGQWGVVDVQDCDYAVRYLASENLVDPERVAIRGGSAGGFTTLAALALTTSFKAGASLYGVSDLTALAEDTHKFESRYLDSLIGPYPQQQALYRERSPINHADTINCPVIFLQGLDDKVVPPNQAEMMIEVLVNKGLKIAYVCFEGEGHGFRQSNNIIKALASELWFYAQVFGFESEPVEGVGFIET